MAIQVRPAAIADLPALVPLFDSYRVFYEQPSAGADARNFIAERLAQGDSHIFVAQATDDGPTLAGFVSTP